METKLLFIKFILVGVFNTLFGYGVFALLLFLGLHYSLAAIFSTIAGILFNFKTTGVLVFKNDENRLILKFIMVYALLCLINIILLKIAQSFGVNLYFAGFVATGLMAVLSFILNKNWVFRG